VASAHPEQDASHELSFVRRLKPPFRASDTYMKKTLLALSLMFVAAAASAGDSPKDVQAMIARGDFPAAETALREAVSEHPQSAKAHYVLAEVLAHEGNIGEARAEANKAATLDPATRFTDPARFQQFQSKLNQAMAPPSASRPAARQAAYGGAPAVAPPKEASFPWSGLLIGAGVIALIAFLWSRRRRDVAPPFAGAPYGSPMNGGPGPGYGPNYGYPPQAPSSGAGAAVAAGLGGLAAGALLDEAFRSHGSGETSREAGFANPPPQQDASPSGQAYDDLRDDPIDMGNNDSSWDDSSSGDSGSSDDDSW
jgi:hypothetical protein